MNHTTSVRTSTLKGTALAHAVAQAGHLKMFILPSEYATGPRLFVTHNNGKVERWWPDQDAGQAWPLLCKHGRRIRLELHFHDHAASYLEAGIRCGHTANDMLTAALRALVSHHLGPTVEIPTELLETGQGGAA